MTRHAGTPGAVRGIDHIGITVPDMEAATRFLRDAFGAAIVDDTVADGKSQRAPADLAATVALGETEHRQSDPR